MQNWKALDKNIGSSDNIVTSERLFLLLLNINQAIFFSSDNGIVKYLNLESKPCDLEIK